MKKIFILLAFFLFSTISLSCTIKKAAERPTRTGLADSNIQNMNWASLVGIKKTLDEHKGPVSILFVNECDEDSIRLLNLLQKPKNGEDILLLNLSYPWAQDIFIKMGLREMPVLVVLDPKDNEKTKKILGTHAIEVYLGGLAK